MFDTLNDEERGQVGIGTLIVFIALVLVAAIAAGVLINTAGFLQSQAESTGQESTSQVANGLQVVEATGSPTGSGSVDSIEVVVSLAPGSDSINLSNVRLEVFGDASGVDSDLNNDVSAGTDPLRNDGDFATIDLTNGNGDSIVSSIDAGNQVELVFVTADGSRTTVVLNPPDPIDDSKSSVSL